MPAQRDDASRFDRSVDDECPASCHRQANASITQLSDRSPVGQVARRQLFLFAAPWARGVSAPATSRILPSCLTVGLVHAFPRLVSLVIPSSLGVNPYLNLRRLGTCQCGVQSQGLD